MFFFSFSINDDLSMISKTVHKLSICKRPIYDIFWQVNALSLSLFYEIVSLRKNSFKFFTIMSIEEPNMRLWERQWNRVTHWELRDLLHKNFSGKIRLLWSFCLVELQCLIWSLNFLKFYFNQVNNMAMYF